MNVVKMEGNASDEEAPAPLVCLRPVVAEIPENPPDQKTHCIREDYNAKA